MNNYQYFIYIVLSKLLRRGNSYIVSKMREGGVKIGVNTHIFSNIALSEPYLISIGDNCTISTNVSFITHDASVGVIMGRENYSDLCGKIVIGNNCFIGNNSIILYGTTIANNTIIAAGSVVTKSVIESGCIIGGNPAKVIGKVENFIDKYKHNFLALHGKNASEKKYLILSSGKLVKK